MWKPLPYSAIPHLKIMRVMIDRKNLHMIYAMSFLNDDFIMLIYTKSFDCNHHYAMIL